MICRVALVVLVFVAAPLVGGCGGTDGGAQKVETTEFTAADAARLEERAAQQMSESDRRRSEQK